MSIFQNSKSIKKQLKDEIQKYQKLNKELENKINYYNSLDPNNYLNLEFSKLSEDWKKILKSDYDKYLSTLKIDLEQKARNILWEAISKVNVDNFKEDYIYKLKCTNDETKSRLIGLNGRNKKCFEKTCGLELIVNKNDDDIKISCTNLLKKELGARLLKRLVDTKNIEPNKIKNFYEEIKNDFNLEIEKFGKYIVEEKLGIFDLNSKIYRDVGLMKYRMSYGQNLLEHSLECAAIAKNLAEKLNLDSKLLIKCAFFHDIGKVLESDINNKNHVDLGVEWAILNKLDPNVINSIEAHHGAVPTNSIYSAIAKFIDEISASREGARTNSKDSFVERVKLYEQICYQFPEVKDCWVLNTGFLVKIIVKPNLVKDDELELLGIRIKKAFEENSNTKVYNITLELIKENVFKIKTDKK